MAVTKIVRDSQIEVGTANRIVVNDADGLVVDLDALTGSRALETSSVVATSATGTIVVVGYASLASAVCTVNDVAYTEGVEWNAETSDEVTATNLATVIGTGACSAVNAGTDTILITAPDPGVAGNAIHLVTSDVVNLTISGAHLTGGVDAFALPTASTTTAAELDFVHDVTGPIQAQLDDKITPALENLKIWVGDGGSPSVATPVTVSGDITLTETALLEAVIGAGKISDGHISETAGIDRSKIAAGSTDNRIVINEAGGALDNIAITASRALASDSSGLPTASTTTAAELDFVHDVTGPIQDQFTDKANRALSNLTTTTLISESLVGDAGNTYDLGTDLIEWKDAWLHAIKHDDVSVPNLTISTEGNNGNIVLFPNGTGTVDVSNKKITSVGLPTADTDAASKLYVDGKVQGLNIHAPCLVATITPLAAVTASGTKATHILTYDAVGVQLVDGHSLVLNNRILVKNQVTTTDNGIYDVTTEPTAGVAGVLTRAVDFNGAPVGEVAPGDFTIVQIGAQAGSGWVILGTAAIVVDTDAIVWTQATSSAAYTAGNGIDVTGQVIKLATLTNGNILVGNVSDVATSVAMSGEATIINTGAVTLNNDAVIGKAITGYVSSADTISASDSILTAIDHLNGNVDAKLPLAGGTLTGALTINPVSNQLVLGGVSAGFKTTISSTAPAADRILTIPVATGDRNFLLSGEAQIVSADLANSAVALTQLEGITDGNIIVGVVTTGKPTSVTMSGDATIINTGAITLATDVFDTTYFITREVPLGDIDDDNLIFELDYAPISGTEHVFLNGILQNAGSGNDYQISTNTITFEAGNAPPTDSELLVSYQYVA